MALVCCLDCQEFTRNTIGFGQGIGSCASYEVGMKSNPSKSAIRQARMIRGNSPENGIFWGGDLKDRDCKKYARKEKPTDPGKGSVGFNENLTTGKIIS